MTKGKGPLVIIPTYLRESGDVDLTMDAVASVRKTAGESVDLLMVDDGSPEPSLVDDLEKRSAAHNGEVHRKEVNDGFSRTVNVGLRRALVEHRDAVLLNADVEIITGGWVKAMRQLRDPRGVPAGVIGAMLLYPQGGTIQHAGVYFSLLTRSFDHLYRFSPPNLAEANEERVCPVTAAFQYIRHGTLEKVGLYDEKFQMAFEDVDFCIRVMLSDLSCMFTHRVRAWHHEQMFRGRASPKIEEWQSKSLQYLGQKYANQSFAGLVPNWEL